MKAYTLAAAVLLASAAIFPAQAQNSGKALEIRHSAQYGPYLVDGDGRALYLFTADRQGEGTEAARSNCYDACATAWPPMTVQSVPEAREAVDQGLLSTIERDTGEMQVTYNGWPLYYWVGDRGQGQATGQDVKQFGGEWYLVGPEGHEVHAQASGGGEQTPLQSALAEMAFQGPECVRYDAANDRYLVSNINGEMRAADDNGFISRLAPDGSGEPKWIAGGENGVDLNAPKGMALAEGTLYVADIDHLRRFDAATGQPIDSIEIEGAKFLNAIAIAPDGTLYVTDSGTQDVPGAIYAVTPDRQVRTIAAGRHLKRPNGIDLSQAGYLIVVTFAGDEVLTISRQGNVMDTRQLEAGRLDGLLVQDDGSRLVSSWDGRHIVRVAPDGATETILTGVRTPAAFDLDPERQQILVPLVQENRIVVAPVG